MSERAIRARLLRIPSRLRHVWAAARAGQREAERMRITSADRLERARAFYGVYEELIESLLAATNFGPADATQRQYAAAAEEMRGRYSALKPYLIAYLRMTKADATYGLGNAGRPLDAFEILYSHERVADLLASDDGEMINRIQRTREALTLYTEHLRTLVGEREQYA